MKILVPLISTAIASMIPAQGATLMILQPAETTDQFRSSPFFVELYERFDEVVVAQLGTPGVIGSADAYVVDLIAGGGINAPLYSAAEMANLSILLNSDRPALIPFEWAAWRNSSEQLAALVGGTYSSSPVTTLPIEEHPILSAGIDGQSIRLGTSGLITWGGTQVIGDIVTLAGPADNVVLLGDSSIVSYALTAMDADNVRFTTNLVDFLAVPEPSAAALSLIALAGVIRRRR